MERLAKHEEDLRLHAKKHDERRERKERERERREEERKQKELERIGNFFNSFLLFYLLQFCNFDITKSCKFFIILWTIMKCNVLGLYIAAFETLETASLCILWEES